MNCGKRAEACLFRNPDSNQKRTVNPHLVLVLILVRPSRKLRPHPHPALLVMPSSPKFDHERLEVYQLELQFVAWSSAFLDELQDSGVRRLREIMDNLDRASLSVLFNTAEGNGRRRGQQRARFFDDARGSGMECAACLDASVARNACAADRIREGKILLHRIVSILTKLVEKFDIERDIRTQEVNDGNRGRRTSTRTRTN